MQVTVNDKVLARKLGIASRVMGKDLGSLIKHYAAPAVMDLMRTFPPMVTVGGKDSFSKQRQLGNAAIDRDVGRVYVSLGTVAEEVAQRTAEPDDGASKAVVKFIRRGRVSEAKDLLRRVGLPEYATVPRMGRFDPALHRGRRNRRGRVGSKRRGQVVSDVASLRRYVRERKAKVGLLKSGFLAGYRAAGGKRSVPRWITRHGRTGRVVDATRKQRNPTFTVINAVDYAGVQSKGGSLTRMVLKRSRARMIRGLDGAVRRQLRQLR